MNSRCVCVGFMRPKRFALSIWLADLFVIAYVKAHTNVLCVDWIAFDWIKHDFFRWENSTLFAWILRDVHYTIGATCVCRQIDAVLPQDRPLTCEKFMQDAMGATNADWWANWKKISSIMRFNLWTKFTYLDRTFFLPFSELKQVKKFNGGKKSHRLQAICFLLLRL